MAYEKIGFKKGDVLKASHLNHMEEGISYISSNMIDNLLPEFSESGAAVECHPFPLCPLDVSTTFEPAQAGSGDPYPAGGGRNLLPINVTTETVNGVTFTVNKDGSISAKGTATGGKAVFDLRVELSALIDVGQTFTVSGCPNVDGCGFHCYYADNPNKAAFNTGIAYGLTATAVLEGKTKYLYIQVASEKTVDTVFYPQIELGSTASEFAPYSNIRPISGYDSLELAQADKTENKNTYTVHLGDTVYGGTYDWGKGELTVGVGSIALDGMEGWKLQNNKYYVLLDSSFPSLSLPNGQDMYCISSHFKNIAWREGDNSGAIGINGTYGIRAYVLKLFPTLDDWKAYLVEQHAAGTPVQIAYKLAEPITIQLAPLEILPLDGTNVLISNPDDITVSGKLDLSYLHEENKTVKAKLADMEARLRALENA